MNLVKYILENDYGIIETNYSFKELTTIEIGGKIKYFYSPNSIDSLGKVFKYINDNNIRYFIIGNGSNILASDEFFDGVVINMKSLPKKLELYIDCIYVGASYPTIKLAYDLSRLCLGDLSFLGGIPGLLGGAIYNNSGAFNDNISNHLIEIDYIDTNGILSTISANNANFSYRSSIFHDFNWIIVGAKIRVTKMETTDKLEKNFNYRINTQPINKKSMGSIFKNHPLIESWKIIDSLGLRGFSINDAEISSKHTNFIINNNNASYEDINSLIELIKRRSENELGIKLETEITFI